MTAKMYLSQFKLIKARIKAKEDRRDVMFSLIASARTPSLKEDMVQGGQRDSIDDRIIEYMELQEEINRDIREAVDMAQRLGKQIEGLQNHLYVEILHRHYIGLKDLKTIADELNYSYVHIRRLHGHALTVFYREFLKDDTQ